MEAATAPAKPAPAPDGPVAARVADLLALDPDLAAGLAPEERAAARLAARAEAIRLPKRRSVGPEAHCGGLGLLVLSGLMARVVRVGRRESLELLGPGDLVQPWVEDEAPLVACTVTWEVLEPVVAARLDTRFMRRIRPWPELSTALSARGVRRSKWLTVQAAIDAHPLVEERLMLLLCHLGERMGRVGPDGVVLELPLSHRLLAAAVRALRPSVTGGLLRLREDGRLVQPGRGRWLITHEGLAYVERLCAQPGD